MAVKLRCKINYEGKNKLYSISTPRNAIMGKIALDNTNAPDAGLDSEYMCNIYKACNTYIESLYTKGFKV